jgi:hypothetical protein
VGVQTGCVDARGAVSPAVVRDVFASGLLRPVALGGEPGSVVCRERQRAAGVEPSQRPSGGLVSGNLSRHAPATAQSAYQAHGDSVSRRGGC